MATFTMRLQSADYEALQAVALLTGRTMTEVARDALTRGLDSFASSPHTRQEIEEAHRAREAAMRSLRARARPDAPRPPVPAASSART